MDKIWNRGIIWNRGQGQVSFSIQVRVVDVHITKTLKKPKIDIFDTVVLRSEGKRITVLSYESPTKMPATTKWH